MGKEKTPSLLPRKQFKGYSTVVLRIEPQKQQRILKEGCLHRVQNASLLGLRWRRALVVGGCESILRAERFSIVCDSSPLSNSMWYRYWHAIQSDPVVMPSIGRANGKGMDYR